MDVMGPIRERIRQLVKASGMSGRAFAVNAGLAPGHVNSILSGEKDNVEVSTLMKIADYAKVSFEYLVVGSGQENRSILREVDSHANTAFPPAARAFLEIEEYSDASTAVVRALLHASFNAQHRWTPSEWFEEMRTAHRRLVHGLQLRSS